LQQYLPYLATGLAVLELVIVVGTLPWILSVKKESTSAVAWCLVVLFLPIVGFILFVQFGYTSIHRPLKRKRSHRAGFEARHPGVAKTGKARGIDTIDHGWQGLGDLAERLGAYPMSRGNEVFQYHETAPAFEALFKAIEGATRHIHLEYYIVQPDSTGRGLIERLAEKARQGVKVRLLYDAVGSFGLKQGFLRPLRKAGGKATAFLNVNPLRRRFQINLRNHRKVAVIDGRLGFIGGCNVGDEYLGLTRRWGYWRDATIGLRGPAVASLQRLFIEDWDFASGETLKDTSYFPAPEGGGDGVVQIISSGPDQPNRSIRDVLLAAMMEARDRIWLASPYNVPDGGILDLLRLKARLGVDVRLLGPKARQYVVTRFAGQYYWPDLLADGVRIYHYNRGMMHSKLLAIDGVWGWVGSSNLDNRSLHLNFEANCILHSPPLVADLERAYLSDLDHSAPVEPEPFTSRPAWMKLMENGCRLLSPVL
jgi:cardiolipin synthase